jgi:hypothetical protein
MTEHKPSYILLVKGPYGWSRNIGADGGNDGNEWDTEAEALAGAAELDKCWGPPADDEDGNPVQRVWRVIEASDLSRYELVD